MTGPSDRYDQAITYWRRSGITVHGDPAWAAAATVQGRWMEGYKLVTAADGQQIGSTASVMVDVDLALQDMVFRGTSADATPPAGARKIVAWRKAQRPGGGLVVRRAFLA